MKRVSLILVVMVIVATLFCGCGVNGVDVQLKSGFYMAEGTGSFEATTEYAEILEPYISIDVEEKAFIYGASPYISYAEYGSYSIEDGKLIANAQNNTIYTFEIKDENTLVMIDDNGKVIDEFVYSEQLN